MADMLLRAPPVEGPRHLSYRFQLICRAEDRQCASMLGHFLGRQMLLDPQNEGGAVVKAPVGDHGGIEDLSRWRVEASSSFQAGSSTGRADRPFNRFGLETMIPENRKRIGAGRSWPGESNHGAASGDDQPLYLEFVLGRDPRSILSLDRSRGGTDSQGQQQNDGAHWELLLLTLARPGAAPSRTRNPHRLHSGAGSRRGSATRERPPHPPAPAVASPRPRESN